MIVKIRALEGKPRDEIHRAFIYDFLSLSMRALLCLMRWHQQYFDFATNYARGPSRADNKVAAFTLPRKFSFHRRAMTLNSLFGLWDKFLVFLLARVQIARYIENAPCFIAKKDPQGERRQNNFAVIYVPWILRVIARARCVCENSICAHATTTLLAGFLDGRRQPWADFHTQFIWLIYSLARIASAPSQRCVEMHARSHCRAR